MEKVYIVLVNYKHWLDTIECIESLIKNDYPNFQIIVVENNSEDNSISRFKDWADGKENPAFNPPEELNQFVLPLSDKPLPYIQYTTEEALQGGIKSVEKETERKMLQRNFTRLKYPIIFIENKTEAGFAHGNNIGIKYSMAKGDMNFVWLLNNDTIIEPSALNHLVEKMKKENNSEKKTGIIGSKILYYHKPVIIQSVGGTFNIYTTQSNLKGIGEEDRGQYDKQELKFDYVFGASMFVRKEFIQDAGLMSEDFFLYFEEIDWCERAKRKKWNIGYAFQSRVYHKQGISTGKKLLSSKRPLFIFCLKYRNLLLFYQRHYPLLLLAAYFRLVYKSAKALREGAFDEVRLIWKIIFGKRTCER